MLTELQQLSLEVYHGTSQYSEKEGNDVIRNMIIEKVGVIPENPSKFARYMEKNHIEIFEVIEEMVTAVHNELALADFGDLVDIETMPLGTRKDFIIESAELFNVGLMATGVRVTQRQKIHDRKLQTKGFKLGVKIYAELFDFLTGKINWTKFVDKVAKSFDKKLCALVTATIFGAYDESGNPFCLAAANAEGVNDKLREVIQKLGTDVVIMGTKAAIANISNISTQYNEDANDRRNYGYVKLFEGTPVVELPNYFDKEVGEFEVRNDMLIVLPAGERIVKLAYEGDVSIAETLQGDRFDYQLEMEMARMVHVAVAIAKDFGMIKITL